MRLKPRQVSVKNLELVDIENKDSAHFRVSSGKGMYVRSLARDIALAVGACGHVSALRRTKVSPFTLENAVSMTKLEQIATQQQPESALMPLTSGLGSTPILTLTPNEAHALRLGHKILVRPHHGDIYKASVIFAEFEGVPIALIEAVAGEFKVVRGFHY